ncbi:MAG: hypothetical protein M1570_00790 [Chloroflexi bacterium]|nr:hypothetical protein [Chloroflexota bacterium]
MEDKRFLIRVPAFTLLVVFALISGPDACTGVVGCGSRCDPIISAFDVSDPWLCPANCPGGGATHINYSIEFRSDKNELCVAPSGFSIKIKNLTDNVDLSPLSWTNPSKGVYSGSVDIVGLTKDTDYELTAAGNGTCSGTITKTLTVKVVAGNTTYKDICFAGKLDWPQEFQGYFPFGPNVLVDHTYNPNDLQIRVGKDSKYETLREHGQGTGFSGFLATGTWTIGLLSAADSNKYDLMPNPELCVRVYLRCDNCK